MARSSWNKVRLALVGTMIVSLAATHAQAVDFANITVVDGADPDVNPPTVTIAAGQGTLANVPLGTQGFFIDNGVVVGEYPIRIGATSTDDAASSTGGVLLSTVRENGRDYPGETIYAITSIVPDQAISGPPTNTRGTSGGFSLVVDRGGAALSTTFPAIVGPPARGENAVMNVNLSAAYFPYSQGWIGATTIASANNSQFSILGSSPGLTLSNVQWQGTTHGPALAGGHHVFIPGVTDSRQQGLVFGVSGKNEDNYVGVQPLATGAGWSVDVHNGRSGAGEGDPLAFVYLPFGSAGITMASVHGASGADQHATVLKSSGSPFTLTRTDVGTYRLSIPGQTPASGVLMLNIGGNINQALSTASERVISYEADGDDWIIETRDVGTVANPVHPFLEHAAERGQAFQFAFMPFNAPPTAPGPNLTPENFKDDIIGYNVEVTEIDGTIQEIPGVITTVTGGTNGFLLEPLRQNRGDFAVAINRVFQSTADGIVFASVSQGFRDNGPDGGDTGGEAAYGIASAGGVDGGWEISTHIADPGLGSTSAVEHNINFSAVQFGRDTDFGTLNYMASNQPQTGGALTVTIPGVNPLTDGVLIAQVYGNNDDFAVATPSGSNWTVRSYDNNTNASSGMGLNYIYLPYEADNLVAGRVDANGTVVNSTGTGTDPGEFTLTKEAGMGSYLLTIAGKTPADGTLLLTAAETAGNPNPADNTMAYEPFGDSFRIFAIDQVTYDEKSVNFVFPSLEDTNFSFAFIDHDAPPTLAAEENADFDADGDVDGADFLRWQRNVNVTTGATLAQGDADGDGAVNNADLTIWKGQFGTAVVAAGAVPEPASVVLVLVGTVAGVAVRRRMV